MNRCEHRKQSTSILALFEATAVKLYFTVNVDSAYALDFTDGLVSRPIMTNCNIPERTMLTLISFLI